MFNQFTIDTRPPWIRTQDEAGDTAASAVMRVLDMEMLLANRRLAIDPPAGIWPGGIEITAPLPHEFVQKIEALAHKSAAVTVEYVMTRDTRIDGVNWELTFKISGRAIMSRRQRTRIGKVLAQFVRTHYYYLDSLDLTTNVNYLQIVVKAKVGVIAEPK